MRILRCSVVLIKNDDKILLGLNKRGFHRGKWTGFGGVVQPKEDLKNCLKFSFRNTKEQCGLNLEKLEKVGKVEIKIAGVQEVVQMHIFLSDSYTGEIKQSREMDIRWFDKSRLPHDSMWCDTNYWMPHIIKGQKIKGFFVYQNESLIYQDLNTDAFNNRFQRRGAYSNGITIR